jgi:hypothetical protein
MTKENYLIGTLIIKHVGSMKITKIITDTNSTVQQISRTITFAIKFGDISVLSPLVRNH